MDLSIPASSLVKSLKPSISDATLPHNLSSPPQNSSSLQNENYNFSLNQLFISGDIELFVDLVSILKLPQLYLFSKNFVLSGYQFYVNPLWVLKRSHLTETFAIYTGNQQHIVHGCIVALISEEALCSDSKGKGSFAQQTLYTSEEYAKGLEILDRIFTQYDEDDLQPQETDDGSIMIGNLTKFSDQILPCLLVPSGDYEKDRPLLVLNLNLRYLGCAERSVLSFRMPSDSTKSRFYQKYHINESTGPFEFCVVELVCSIQRALFVLGLFPDSKLVDGLICDSTLAALREFCLRFGVLKELDSDTELCDFALFREVLDTVEINRKRLAYLGHVSIKHPFLDPLQFCRQIKHFQRIHGLHVTHVLDNDTITRLEILSRSQQRQQNVANYSDALRHKVQDFTGLPVAHKSKKDGDGMEQTDNSIQNDLDRVLRTIAKEIRLDKSELTSKKRSRKRDRLFAIGSQLMQDAAYSIDPVVSQETKDAREVEERKMKERETELSNLKMKKKLILQERPSGASNLSVPTEVIVREDLTSDEDIQYGENDVVDFFMRDPGVTGVIAELAQGPARVLKGIKRSTSRTIEEIVERGKFIKSGVKNLSYGNYQDDELVNSSSDDGNISSAKETEKLHRGPSFDFSSIGKKSKERAAFTSDEEAGVDLRISRSQSDPSNNEFNTKKKETIVKKFDEIQTFNQIELNKDRDLLNQFQASLNNITNELSVVSSTFNRIISMKSNPPPNIPSDLSYYISESTHSLETPETETFDSLNSPSTYLDKDTLKLDLSNLSFPNQNPPPSLYFSGPLDLRHSPMDTTTGSLKSTKSKRAPIDEKLVLSDPRALEIHLRYNARQQHEFLAAQRNICLSMRSDIHALRNRQTELSKLVVKLESELQRAVYGVSVLEDKVVDAEDAADLVAHRIEIVESKITARIGNATAITTGSDPVVDSSEPTSSSSSLEVVDAALLGKAANLAMTSALANSLWDSVLPIKSRHVAIEEVVSEDTKTNEITGTDVLALRDAKGKERTKSISLEPTKKNDGWRWPWDAPIVSNDTKPFNLDWSWWPWKAQ
ncbi:hypothetical protein HK096_008848 [Nowakowskiella sp. JEL0078]|nr:hypothetical protein HK096_008848 [Nowakowskiella sp. JEL0078]